MGAYNVIHFYASSATFYELDGNKTVSLFLQTELKELLH